MKYLILAVLFFSAIAAQADVAIHPSDLYVISSFEKMDYFTTYDHDGKLLWEIPFQSKIVSWKLEEGLLVVHSRHREGLAYYLSCVDPKSGEIKWERAIWAPLSN